MTYARTALKMKLTKAIVAACVLSVAFGLPSVARATAGSPQACTVGETCTIGEFLYDDLKSPFHFRLLFEQLCISEFKYLITTESSFHLLDLYADIFII